jgi:hypothetical protein
MHEDIEAREVLNVRAEIKRDVTGGAAGVPGHIYPQRVCHAHTLDSV